MPENTHLLQTRYLQPKDYFGQQSHVFDYDHRYNVLIEQILFEAQRYPNLQCMLDIGCGSGIAGDEHFVKNIAGLARQLWGVEPDPHVPTSNAIQHVWRSTLENADIPDESVQLAYSYLVLEHVTQPREFLAKLHRILTPGGTFLAVTINASSVFAIVARWCHSLGIQDGMLRFLRGKQVVENYHYPAVYRMNSLKQIRRESQLHFSTIDVSYFENGEIRPYFQRLKLAAIGKLCTTLSSCHPSLHSTILIRLRK